MGYTSYGNYMPTFLTAQQFSDWEFCPRLVQLGYRIEPPSWPVRLALKRYLLMAVRRLARGTAIDSVAWDVQQDFLTEAANRGFDHIIPVTSSERNSYLLMRDYACWLESAVHLLDEQSLDLTLMEPVYVRATPIYLDCWLEREHPECAHTFRIVDRKNTADHARWLELLASLDTSISQITVHSFILPAPTRDRLHSPLVMAYSHPLTGHMRLAQRDKEKVIFGHGWKMIARWETENTGNISTILWPEWRDGIEKDTCLDRCYEESVIDLADRDPEQTQTLLEDAGTIVQAIKAKGEQVRKWELCGRCRMNSYCHGDQASREGYLVISSRVPASTRPASPAAAQTSREEAAAPAPGHAIPGS
jgi:hypothetical protein